MSGFGLDEKNISGKNHIFLYLFQKFDVHSPGECSGLLPSVLLCSAGGCKMLKTAPFYEVATRFSGEKIHFLISFSGGNFVFGE